MAIGSDYPRPIMVNGYECRNCDDVSDAKRNIDPNKSLTDLAEAQKDSAEIFGASSVLFSGIFEGRRSSPLTVSVSAGIGQSIDRFA